MAAVCGAAASCLAQHLQGEKSPRKQKQRGVRIPPRSLPWIISPPSSPSSHFKNKYICRKWRKLFLNAPAQKASGLAPLRPPPAARTNPFLLPLAGGCSYREMFTLPHAQLARDSLSGTSREASSQPEQGESPSKLGNSHKLPLQDPRHTGEEFESPCSLLCHAPISKKHLVHRGFWGAGLIPVMCHPLVHFYSFFLEPTPSPELLFLLAPCILAPGTGTHPAPAARGAKPRTRAKSFPCPSSLKRDKPSGG